MSFDATAAKIAEENAKLKERLAATHGRDVKTLSKETLKTRKEISQAHTRGRELDEEEAPSAVHAHALLRDSRPRILRAGLEPLASKCANSGTCLQVIKLENAALKDNLLHVTGRDEKWLSDDIQDARLQGALPHPSRSTPCMLYAAAREAHVTIRCVRQSRCDVQRRRIGCERSRWRRRSCG